VFDPLQKSIVLANLNQDHSAPTLNDTLPVTQVNSLALPGDSTSRPSLGPYITQRNSSRITKDTLSLPKVSLSGERTSRPATGPYSEVSLQFVSESN